MIKLLPLLYLLSLPLLSTLNSLEKPAARHAQIEHPAIAAALLNGSPFHLSEETVLLGEQVCVKLIAQGFEQIRGMQYSIHFDATRLSFQGVEINAATGLGLLESDFNLSSAALGVITMVYLPPNGQAQALADGTILYEICFLAESEGITEVSFADEPTPILVIDEDLASLPIGPENNGQVEVLLCQDTTVTIDTAICQGSSILIGNIVFTASGQYTIPLMTAVGGCDSTILLNLSTTDVGFAFPPTTLVCPGSQATLQAPDSIRVGLVGGALGQAIVLGPGASYDLTLQNINNGCSATQTVTIGSFPLPDVAITGEDRFCAGDSTSLTAVGAVGYLWNTGETTAEITVSAAGTYSVTGTDANGCINTASITVTELPLPTVAIEGDGRFCPGESTTLTAMGAEQYIWSTGEMTTSIIVSSPGSYSVTGTDTNGCVNIATMIVEELPLPVVSIAGQNGFCTGGSTTLTASGAAQYLWSTGETGAAITISTPGLYSVTGTDVNGCSAIASFTVVEFPLPDINFIGNTQVCTGQTTTITAVGGDTYAWSNGFTAPSVSLGIGTFTVTVTNAQGCSAEASITVTGDGEAPAFIFCPGNRTGVLNYQETSISVNWIEPLAIDNCGTTGLTLSSTHQPGDAFSLGTTTVIYTATDGAGNTSECRFDIIVENSADLTFYVDSLGTTYSGDTACVPIRVLAFNRVDGFQFTMVAPDPALGQIIGIEPLGLLASFNMGDVEFNLLAPNTYGIIWANSNIFGLSLPDSTAIFNVKMLLDLGPDECAPLRITGQPIAIEASQEGSGVVPTVIGSSICLIRAVDIGGQIYKVNGEPIGRAEVFLTGGAMMADTTIPQGFYGFNQVPGGAAYTLRPERDFDDREGVSLLDMVRILRHILFAEPFDNDPFAPYLLIAADANNDQLITVADLVELQDLILGRINELNSNVSWRFVPTSYTFPAPGNPWAEVFPESVTLNNLVQNALNIDFYGIKIGDVNLTALGQFQPSGTNFLMVPEQSFEAGAIVEVPLYASLWEAPWAGFQAELDFDPAALEFLEATVGSLPDFDPKRCVGTHATREGHLPLLWMSLDAEGAKPEGALFSLRFRAKQAGRLSSVLQLSARGLEPMAVTADLKVQQLGLSIGALAPTASPTAARSIAGLRVLPNPFSEQAELLFELKEAEVITISLFNAQGQLLHQERRFFGAGPQHFTIEGEWMRQSSIYLCQVQAGGQAEWVRLVKQ